MKIKNVRDLPIANCTAMALRRAARRVSQLYDSKLEPTRLKVTQYVILVTLSHFKEMSVNDIAENLDIERTTIGKNLRPLQRGGLIKIMPSDVDGRSRLVVLTPKGAATLREATPLWRKAHREFEKSHGKGNTDALLTSLSRIELG